MELVGQNERLRRLARAQYCGEITRDVYRSDRIAIIDEYCNQRLDKTLLEAVYQKQVEQRDLEQLQAEAKLHAPAPSTETNVSEDDPTVPHQPEQVVAALQETQQEKPKSKTVGWIATALVVVVIAGIWLIINYR